jgi:hypothetical protein
MAAGGSNTLPL